MYVFIISLNILLRANTTKQFFFTKGEIICSFFGGKISQIGSFEVILFLKKRKRAHFFFSFFGNVFSNLRQKFMRNRAIFFE